MIGKLLGHAKVQTTARYAHLGRNSVKVAAARISDSLEADMDTRSGHFRRSVIHAAASQLCARYGRCPGSPEIVLRAECPLALAR